MITIYYIENYIPALLQVIESTTRPGHHAKSIQDELFEFIEDPSFTGTAEC
ncbi:MAG: hypothetical protein ACKO16_08950 [Gemmataceae bacterium]